MDLTQSLAAFTVAAAILAITPGVDTLMVVRTATLEGPRRAAFAAAGIAGGCLVWGGAVALGIGALFAASPGAFAALRWIGAGYLVWLGGRLLWKPRGALGVSSAEPSGPAEDQGRGALAWALRGLMTNLLNPKVGVFYVTFLPQFVPPGVSVAHYTFMLAAIHVLLGILWFAILIAAAVPLGRALRRPAVVRVLDRVTGCVFVAFGAKLALSR